MVEESKDEELPLLEAPAPRFGDDAYTEDEALDTSVPVAFLTSTRANPDLGYRVPTSASALLATRSQDRAALLRQETLARRAFSMAEVDVREHARARRRVDRERRKRDALALDVERRRYRERHFLEVDGGAAPVAPGPRERPHLDRAAQRSRLRRREPGAPFVDAAPRSKAPDAKPYRPLPAKDAVFVGNSVAADICRQRTRAERAFKRERLDAQKAQSKRDERRRRATLERETRELRERIRADEEARKKIALRQRFVADKYKTAASVESKAQLLKCLALQYLRDAAEGTQGPEPTIAWRETRNETGTVYARESVCVGAPPKEPPTLRRDTLTLPDPPGYRRRRRAPAPAAEAPREPGAEAPCEPGAGAGAAAPAAGDALRVRLPPTDPAPPPGDVRRPAARRPALALAASSRALEDQSILEGASVLDADAGPGPPDLGPLAE